MEMNLKVNLTPEKIAELTDQLPQKDFSRVRKLIEGRALFRFKQAAHSARQEFQRSGLVRSDVEKILADVRAKKKSG